MVVTVSSSAPMMMMMTGPMAMCLQMFTLYPGVALRPEATLICPFLASGDVGE